MTIYSFIRVMNILGILPFLEKLKKWKPDYKGISLSFPKMDIMEAFGQCSFLSRSIFLPKNDCPKSARINPS